MGLKSFLTENGFLTPEKLVLPVKETASKAAAGGSTFLTTTFSSDGASTTSAPTTYVAPGKTPKDAFLKFFEDAMREANLPGDDYYEFRIQLSKMRERMGNRTSEDALLESVLINFEAKNIYPKDLIAFADHYLQALTSKKDQFINEAGNEKVNIQQQREGQIVQAQKDIDAKLQRIEQMKHEIEGLQAAVAQQNNSMEVTRSSIKEATQKIDDSQVELQTAFDFMATGIRGEIKILTGK